MPPGRAPGADHGPKGEREIRTKIADLIANLEHRSASPASEALFELLGRGPAALAALSEWASTAGGGQKLAGLLATNPVRSIAVYGSVGRRAREILDPPFDRLDPEIIVRAGWKILTSNPPPCEIAGPVAGLVQRAAQSPARSVTDGRDGPGDSAPVSAAASTAARALCGVIASRSGDRRTALEALGPVCRPEGEFTLLSPPEAVCCALELFSAACALGRAGSAADALGALLELGQAEQAAGLAARLVGSPPGGAEGLAVVLDRVLDRTGSAGRPWLGMVWSALLDAASARQRLRRGYFAEQLRLLRSRVLEMAGLLREGEELAGGLGLAESSAVCAQISARVAELIGELVVYQPLRVEAVSPREIALEVVVSSREELAEHGVRLSTAPEDAAGSCGNRSDALPVTDRAVVRSVLCQALQRIGRAAWPPAGKGGVPEGPAVVATGWTATDGGGDCRTSQATVAPEDPSRYTTEPPAAFFRLAAQRSPERATRRARRAGGPHRAPLAQRLRALIRESTIADALSRVGGRMSLEAARETLELVFVFPSITGQGEPAPAAEVPAELPEELIAGASGGLRATGRLAEFLIAARRTAAERGLAVIGEELGILLHDLKNSLAFVSGWLRGGDPYDPETVRRRCLESVEDVQFWLSEAGAMLARSEESAGPYTDVGASVRRVLRGLAAAAAEKRVGLTIDLPEASARVPAESFRVASVVRNLAKNGLEACPPGTELAVRVEPDRLPGMVCVTVRDSGPGFPPEALSGGGSLARGNGYGRPRLGLVSSRRVLEESGGRLILANDGGGAATAAFPKGEGTARLDRETKAWGRLAGDARRAMRAAAAMAAAGDTGMARHLWGKALEIQSRSIRARYRRHEFLPAASAMLAPGGRHRLADGARAALERAYPEVDFPRACRRAAALLSAVVRDRFRPADAGIEDLALLVAIGGVESGDPSRLARALDAARRVLEDPGAGPERTEHAVLDALEALVLFGS